MSDADFIRDELEIDDDMPRRQPRAGDPIYVNADRRTILAVASDRVKVDDDSGFRVSIQRDRMWWDGNAFRVAM